MKNNINFAPTGIYGTAKIHKFFSKYSFPKLCLLVSPAGTFNYSLTHFVCNLLSPLVPDDYLCNDSFSFIYQISNAIHSSKFIVSYDVISLFTNIPPHETIDIATNFIFSHNPNLNITKNEL